MNRTICSVLLATVALVLVGCGASVDGGSGVFKNEADLAVTSSIDKTSVVPGTNLLQKMTLTNNGPRDATDAKLVFFGESQGSGWPVLFALPFELQANCSVNGVGELGEFEYVEGGFAVEASLSLEFGSSVECDVRVPVLYTNVLNTSPDMLEIITCAEEDPDNPDPDDSNDCATNEAAVESAQDIVDFRDEIIYWALTDRFNNGDPLNDDLPGTRTADAADPDNADGWHGGDFAGLKQKIEEGYFQSMGFTAIWISPVVFQVAPTFQNPAGDDFTAYHGYWLENFDDNEPHFGTWQELNALVQTAHDNDLKIIIDIVLNHTGEGAALVSSEPDWFREGAPACGNPAVDYVCEIAGNLPDLRQENEEARQWLLDGARNILLQSGADGFRIDTYKHVNPDFWYDFFAPGGPGDRSTVFSMGESFTDAIVRVAQALDWDGAPYMFDFPLRDATTDSLARRSSSTDNVAAVLDTDNLYLDPTRLVTFLDNHDVDRFMTEAISGGASESEAEERLDMALGLQYGVRGVPQVYYGTELAYQGTESPLRSNRKDMTFPNGALARLASLNKAGPGLSQKVTCGVTGTGDPAEAYGVPIFARGGFNDWGAVPAAEFQNLGSVVYQAEFPIAAGTWEFKVADADWAVVDFTADGVVNLGEPVTLVPGSGASNSTITIVADGCYNFALDVTDTAAPVLTITQVTLSKTTCGVTGTGDPAEAYGVPIFARGGFNDWGAVPAAEFQNLGSVVYQAEFPIAAGTWEFKVADADWAVVDFTADGVVNLGEPVTLVPGSGASNSTITIPADGCYNFALDVTDTAAPVLTVTEVPVAKPSCGVTGTGDPAEAYGVPIFARGGFNDWGAVPAAEFQNLGSVVYQAEFPIAAGTWEFKVADADWAVVDFTADGVVNLGEPVTLVPGSGASNSTITIPADGCYNFALDVTDTAAPILTVTEVDVIPGTREVDLFDRLASLAAARGNYEALRRGTQDVIFTPSQGCSVGDTGNDPTEAFGVEMFARGTFNGWGAPSVDSFVNLGGGIYQANVLLSSGTEGYKVAAGDWSIELADENRPDPTPLDTEVLLESAVGPGEEGNIDVADDGCYSFTMNANDAAAPKLTISFLGAFDVIDVMAIQRDMEGAASVVVVVNNEDEEVDLTTLGGGGIPVPFADGPVVEITGADNDLVVSGGVLQGTVPARSSLLVSDQ